MALPALTFSRNPRAGRNQCGSHLLTQQLIHTIREVFEILRDAGVARLERAVDVDRVPVLLRRDERDTRALVPSAPSAAGAVDVVLHVVRRIVIDDELELLHVQPTCGDGRGNDDRHDARLEVSDSRVSVYLVLAAVQRHTEVALAHELSQEIVCSLLTVDEDERAALRVLVVCLAEDLQQPVELALFFANLDNLVDFCSDNGPTTDSDLEGFSEDFSRQRIHLPGKGCGEENRLAIGPNVVDDLHDLRLETHVEHAVCLVQYEICYALQVGNATRIRSEQVNHASWRADDDFRTLLHLSDLVFDWRTPIRAYSL